MIIDIALSMLNQAQRANLDGNFDLWNHPLDSPGVVDGIRFLGDALPAIHKHYMSLNKHYMRYK